MIHSLLPQHNLLISPHPTPAMSMPLRLLRDAVQETRDNLMECMRLIATLRRLRRGVPDPWALAVILDHGEAAMFWSNAYNAHNLWLMRRLDLGDDETPSSSTVDYGPVPAEGGEEEPAEQDFPIDTDEEEFALFGPMEVVDNVISVTD